MSRLLIRKSMRRKLQKVFSLVLIVFILFSQVSAGIAVAHGHGGGGGGGGGGRRERW